MKKEKYFTSTGTEKKAQKILREAGPYLRKKEFSISGCALLVVDAQGLFFEKKSASFIPASISVTQNIQNLIDYFEKRNRLIVFTRHIDDPQEPGLMKVWWKKLLTEKDPESKIYYETKNHKVIKKPQYDAFFKTDLEKYLGKNKIKRLVICGISTDICCDTTARSAFVRNFEVFFPIDATAAKSYELHRSSIITLSHGFVYPVLTKEIIGE